MCSPIVSVREQLIPDTPDTKFGLGGKVDQEPYEFSYGMMIDQDVYG